MLIAIGPGVTGLQDYTNYTDIQNIKLESIQGSTNDTCDFTVFDLSSSFPIQTEDDVYCLDETDPTGWPTVNLLQDPSFEGTYASGIAPNWTGNATGATGVTVTSSATALYGSKAQSITLANETPLNDNNGFFQTVTLPVDENGNPILALPYVFSASVRAVGTPSNVSLNVNIEWFNAANTRLAISTTTVALGAGNNGVWTRYSVQGTAPAGTTHVTCDLYLNATNATNSAQILYDGAQFEYCTFANFHLSTGLTALVSGKYPTPYCDSTQPGCYVETGLSGLPFRQFRLFGGLARIATAIYFGPARTIEVQGVDFTVLLGEAPATLIIFQQADNTAIQAAVTYAQNLGFLIGINATTYVSNIAQVDAHAYSWSTTKEVITQIANQTVAAFWVDYYKFLHYMPALAVNAPYGLSDSPDFVTTFPYADFQYVLDATESRTSPVIEGSSQLSNPLSQTQSGNGVLTSFTFNSGSPIEQIDSLTVGGVAQTVGLANVNTFAQGYNALLTPAQAIVQFNVAPPNAANNIVCIFRFLAPVIIRVRLPPIPNPTSHRKRSIHNHQKIPYVTSQRAAIDRANADLTVYQKARPVAQLTVHCPPWPKTTPIRIGTAIAITHTAAGFNKQLFQVQQVDILPRGNNGEYVYQLYLGFYRPDFALLAAQAVQEQTATASDTIGDGVLTDVISVSDGWTITDSTQAIVANTGVWGNPTSSTWGGAFVWG